MAIVWFTAAQGTPRVVLARSQQRDASFTFLTIDDEGMVGRPDVAILEDGSCLVLFVVQASESTELVAARYLENGEENSRVVVATLQGGCDDGFPRIVSRGSLGAIVTWTDAHGVGRVRAASLEVTSQGDR